MRRWWPPARGHRLRGDTAPNAPRQRAAGARGRQTRTVEKAFTMNADEARELVASARAKGLFLMEAMWARFLPHIAAVNRLLAAGALGDIVTVMADHGQWFPRDPPSVSSPPSSVAARSSTAASTRCRSSDRSSASLPRSRGVGRTGLHRCRRPDLDALRVRQRRAVGAHLHLFGQEPDDCHHRRHRGPTEIDSLFYAPSSLP